MFAAILRLGSSGVNVRQQTRCGTFRMMAANWRDPVNEASSWPQLRFRGDTRAGRGVVLPSLCCRL